MARPCGTESADAPAVPVVAAVASPASMMGARDETVVASLRKMAVFRRLALSPTGMDRLENNTLDAIGNMNTVCHVA